MELFKSRTRVAYTNAVGDKVYPVIVDIKRGIKSTEDIQFVSSDIRTGGYICCINAQQCSV